MTSPLASAAADYMRLGLSVIALTGKAPNGKVHRHGLKDAFSAPGGLEDPGPIVAAFGHPDTTGVGILTSWPYVVVDIDGPEGAKQWLALVGEDHYLSDRWVAVTGRGLHLWYACLLQTGTIKLGPQLDLKGEGGYVVAPPSAHPDGGVYTWLAPPEGDPPLELPPGLNLRIQNHLYQTARRIVGKAQRKTIRGPRYTPGDHVFYAQTGFDAVIDAMRTAEEGNRNHMLYWAAMTLAEEGATDEDYERLCFVALKAGLTSIETARTIQSARRA